jgi:hypothetical protein
MTFPAPLLALVAPFLSQSGMSPGRPGTQGNFSRFFLGKK